MNGAVRRSAITGMCLALLAAGQGAVTSAATSRGSAVSITYGRWGSADEIAANKVLLSAFERANKGIKVAQQVADWNTYWTKLPTQMAAGQAPDAFLLDPGYYQTHYAGTNRLLALDDLIKRDHINMGQYWPQELPTFRYRGHYYELPRDISVNMLLWNKTLFARAHIKSAPSSWQVLLNDAEKMTLDSKGRNASQKGFDPNHIVQWGYASYEYLDGIDEPLITEMGGHLWSQPETGSNVSVSSIRRRAGRP